MRKIPANLAGRSLKVKIVISTRLDEILVLKYI
jgi:hypothetical protein